jgi:hypothetical protein
MRIEATFIGCKSLGYFPGQEYVLQVLTDNTGKKPYIVEASPPAKRCPYSSWRSFWKNWVLTKDNK